MGEEEAWWGCKQSLGTWVPSVLSCLENAMTLSPMATHCHPDKILVTQTQERVDEAHIFLSPTELVHLDTEPSSALPLEMFSPFKGVGLLSRRAARKRTPHQDCFLTEEKQSGRFRQASVIQTGQG